MTRWFSLRALPSRSGRTLRAVGLAPLVLFVLASPPEVPSSFPDDAIGRVEPQGSPGHGARGSLPLSVEVLVPPVPAPTRAGSARSLPGHLDGRGGSDASARLAALRRLDRREAHVRPLPALPAGFLPDKALAPPVTA